MNQHPVHGPASPLVMEHLPARRPRLGLGYAEGPVLVAEAFAGSWPIEGVFIDTEFADTPDGAHLLAAAARHQARIHRCTAKAIFKLSSVESPPPVAVLVRPPLTPIPRYVDGAKRLLVLDRISDPGNAGALIRTAAAFGARVIITTGSVSLTNDKLIRSSAGTCFHANAVAEGLAAPELADLLAATGFRVLALDAGGATLLQGLQAGRKPTALVLGNEARGVDWTAWQAAERVRIDMAGCVESLNVSISGALALYELSRSERIR